MVYSPSSTNFNKLYGQKFTIYQHTTSENIAFEIPEKAAARIRMGAEAFGILVDCIPPRIGRLKSFLKIFKYEVSEREGRTNFLVKSGLATRHPWVFHGIPYAWLSRFEVAGVPIIGHVALQIGAKYAAPAEDFAHLWRNWRTVARGVRRRLAMQLCAAVEGLERMDIVHGDISPGNIMIGPGPDGNWICTLCDFDGFYHPTQPNLPRKVNGMPCRPLGSPGYMYQEIIDRSNRDINGDDPSIVVKTDRFALGVICCELVAVDQEDLDALKLDSLLNAPNGQLASLGHVPATITNLWPAGFTLLEKAMNASSLSAIPGPKDWLHALDSSYTITPGWSVGSHPRLMVLRGSGNSRSIFAPEVNLLAPTGDLGEVHPDLKCIGFRFDGSSLTFDISWPHRIFIQPRSADISDGPGPKRLAIGIGQSLISHGWEIRVGQAIHKSPSP